MLKKTLVMLSLASLFAACQNYTYVFQPDRDRQGVHLRFAVQQPSKADILFVIDNSVSMKEEQSALNNSISYLLNFLAPLDTRYRLGIVSTDTIGYTTGTQGCLSGEEGLDLGDAVYGGEAKGNCTPDPARDIPLRRTHDGTGGRLIAAYDPLIFDAGNPIYDDLSSDDKTRLQSLFPTSIDDGPVGSDGLKGARWVIDREAIRVDACLACECSVDFGDTWACDMADTSCFAGDGTGCVERIAPKLVEAYFRANVNGLGVTGMGWEQGLKAALLAAGIDPDTDSNSDPFNPELSLVRAEDNAPNTIYTWDETGRMSRQSWMRDDALFGMMFVSDEEDSSMPSTLWHEHVDIEDYFMLPDGGLCYIDETQNSMLSSSRMVDLVTQHKTNKSRVAVGFIGGVKKTGPIAQERSQAESSDCVAMTEAPAEATDFPEPSDECGCLTGAYTDTGDFDNRWCELTTLSSSAPVDGRPTCDALAGSRYLDFCNGFNRRTFDSVCLSYGDAFGPALEDFAKTVNLACFALENIRPTSGNADLVEVYRTRREDVGTGVDPALLPMLDPDVISEEEGWYYDVQFNRICLLGLDRLVEDEYDIFILHTDYVSVTTN